MKRLTYLATFLSLTAVWLSPATAGPKKTLGAVHPAASLVDFEHIDHSAWNVLLQKYVDENGYVNYDGWRRSADDLATLDGYLRALSRANPDAKSSNEAKIAFWCNAYNAVTIRGILQEYPTTSIRDHTAKVFGYNIWKDLMLQVGPSAYSLHSIENDILRQSGDARIHFAIVCASIGCPRLLNEAYTGPQLGEQLTRNTFDFFSRSQNFQVRGSSVSVSAILKWYSEDFGKTPEEGIQNLRAYLPANAEPVVSSGRFRVGYLDYDWNLNDQASLRSSNR